MKTVQQIISLVLIAVVLSGCNEKEPFTIMFTSDVRGRVLPAG